MTTALDIGFARRQFPAAERFLYLDAAHQTPLANCVCGAIERFLAEGSDSAGPKATWLGRVGGVRQKAAVLLNASPGEIAFTKNTSEGLNIAANAIPLAQGDTVLLLAGDHPNNAYAWLNLRRKGVNVRFISIPDHEVASADTFAPHVDARTRVISLSHVTFHAGQRHDLESIGRLCQELGIYLVVDAMQSIGVLPLDVKALGVSVLAAGCHKGLLVPQGLGLLYVSDDVPELQPPSLALSSLRDPPADFVAQPGAMATRTDARRFEFGNLNLLALHGLDSALDMLGRLGVKRIEEHVCMLGDRLLAHMDSLKVPLVGPRHPAQRAHIYVLDLPVDEWMTRLASRGVRVSPERGGVRVSFGCFNTIADVDLLAGYLAEGMS